MGSKVVRVPEEVHEQVVAASQVLHRTPAELIAAAWRAYRENEEFVSEFELARKAFVTGDLDALAQRLAARRQQRADASAVQASEMFRAGDDC